MELPCPKSASWWRGMIGPRIDGSGDPGTSRVKHAVILVVCLQQAAGITLLAPSFPSKDFITQTHWGSHGFPFRPTGKKPPTMTNTV